MLGFDPSLVTTEKLTEVYSLAKLVHDDQTTRLIITQFIEDYIKAQHQLEWSEFSGGASFEVILTALLAVVTGGVGAVASLGAQARKISQLKKLGELLSELAELLKTIPKDRNISLRQQKELEDKKAAKQKTPTRKKQVKNDGIVEEDSVTQKVDVLDNEGHAPVRHGGPNRVTDSQLENRAVKGIDPASGTIYDAFNMFPNGSPKRHKVGRNATAFSSDSELLKADIYVRGTKQFQLNIAKARANGDLFVDAVELPLKDVFGNDYKHSVRGVARLGSKKNPTGHESIDFTNGTIKAI